MRALMICQLRKKTENLNNKFMKNDFEQIISFDEPIVILDECGDSLWDAVLGQEVNMCDVKGFSSKAYLLLNDNELANESDENSFRESH